MKHLSEGELQAYLDRALAPDQWQTADAHLATCIRCATELAELREAATDFAHALKALDLEPAALPIPVGRRVAHRRVTGTLLRAAVITLIVGGVALGALPESPVRVWVEGMIRPGEGGDVMVPLGVAILPLNGEATLQLYGPAEGTELRTRLIDGQRLKVQWSGTDPDPHFRTSPGRIEVIGGGVGTLLVEVPRGADIAIEVDGQPYLVAEGGRLRALVPAERGGPDDVVFQRLDRGGAQ